MSKKHICFGESVLFTIPISLVVHVKKPTSTFITASKELVIIIKNGREYKLDYFTDRNHAYDVIMDQVRNHVEVDAIKVTLRDDVEDQSMRELFPLPDPPYLMEDSGILTERHSVREEWQNYFVVNGRDVGMIRTRQLLSLVQKGIPDDLRGEMWILFSGASYTAFEPNYYERLLNKNEGNPEFKSVLEEIEKDVKRSNEHPAFQTEQGINALRRVLSAYAFRNPSLGYAQAMNIVASKFLLFLKETDAFCLLCTLCERIMPDHYSKTLVGSVIDQRVLHQLVQDNLIDLHNHFKVLHIEMSMLAVPWFVCLFVSILPFKISCRVLDLFFYLGSVFLFKLALAILKKCESMLLQASDDDQVMRIIRMYFKQLNVGNNADELFECALQRFIFVDSDKIEEYRNRFRLQVVQKIEDSVKRNVVRDLQQGTLLSIEEVELIYDCIKRIQFFHQDNDFNFKDFCQICYNLLPWRSGDRKRFNFFDEPVSQNEQEPTKTTLLHRLHTYCLTDGQMSISKIVQMMDIVHKQNAREKVKLFYSVHCVDVMTQDELMDAAESMVWMFRGTDQERIYLEAVSHFLNSALKVKVESVTGEINSFVIGFDDFVLCVFSQDLLLKFFGERAVVAYHYEV